MVFTPSMTSIYPPVVTPEQNELDIEFNRTYTPRLKTSNRFAKKKAKSSKTKGTEPKPINTEIHIDAPVEGTAVWMSDVKNNSWPMTNWKTIFLCNSNNWNNLIHKN